MGLLEDLKNLIAGGGNAVVPPLPLTKKPDFNFDVYRLQVSASQYVTNGSQIHFIASSFTAGVIIQATYRIVLASGEVKGFSKTLTTLAGYANVTLSEILPECVILNVSARSTTAQHRGQTYVAVKLDGGHVTDDSDIWTLCEGYVSNSFPVSFPITRTTDSETGEGYRSAVVVPNPAAGAGATYTQPANYRSRVFNVSYVFQTSVAVAFRTGGIRLTLSTGGSRLIRSVDSQAESLIRIHIYMNGILAYQGNPNIIYTPIPPDMWLMPSDTLAIEIDAIQTADQVSSIILLLEHLKIL